jgi:hypothetical protein
MTMLRTPTISKNRPTKRIFEARLRISVFCCWLNSYCGDDPDTVRLLSPEQEMGLLATAGEVLPGQGPFAGSVYALLLLSPGHALKTRAALATALQVIAAT